MKAATNKSYGPPSIISIKEVKRPKPNPKEVLVKTALFFSDQTDVGFLEESRLLSDFLLVLVSPSIYRLVVNFQVQSQKWVAK